MMIIKKATFEDMLRMSRMPTIDASNVLSMDGIFGSDPYSIFKMNEAYAKNVGNQSNAKWRTYPLERLFG